VLILRRRTFVINRKLQFSIMLTSLGYVGLLVLVMTISLFAPLILQLQRPDWNSTETSDAALRILYLHETYWLPVLLTLVAIALHSVASSHRIAGPIFRFRRVFDAMAAGIVPTRVTLRKNDHLRPELDAVNAMLDRWRRLVAQSQHDAALLQEALAAYGGLPAAKGGNAAANAAWAEVVRSHDRLRDTLGEVTVEGTFEPGCAPEDSAP
jgi:methyl-accepting chemotaxis protein